MYSSHDNECSHSLGSPIRKSPDHRMFTSPRGLSQLTTSFIACLCLGIPTYALSSLTIKSILSTQTSVVSFQSAPGLSWKTNPSLPGHQPPYTVTRSSPHRIRGDCLATCGCPSIFNFQRSKLTCSLAVSSSMNSDRSFQLLLAADH